MNENIKKFLEEYGKLVKKYNVDLVSYPMFVPSAPGEFKIIVQSTPIDLSQKEEKVKVNDLLK